MDILSNTPETIERGSSIVVNWTNEDFIGKWDGKTYQLKAGRAVKVELGDAVYNAHVATHFANGIADRELDKDGLPTDHHTRQNYIDKCFVGVEAPKEETTEFEEEVNDVRVEAPAANNEEAPKRRGRPAANNEEAPKRRGRPAAK